MIRIGHDAADCKDVNEPDDSKSPEKNKILKAWKLAKMFLVFGNINSA